MKRIVENIGGILFLQTSNSAWGKIWIFWLARLLGADAWKEVMLAVIVTLMGEKGIFKGTFFRVS